MAWNIFILFHWFILFHYLMTTLTYLRAIRIPSNAWNYILASDIYTEHQNLKKTEYEERVLESEKGSFTPLIFTTSGGMGPECTSFFKRLAELITAKNNERYAYVINHMRTGLRFSILRSTLIGIRGERGRYILCWGNKIYNNTRA